MKVWILVSNKSNFNITFVLNNNNDWRRNMCLDYYYDNWDDLLANHWQTITEANRIYINGE